MADAEIKFKPRKNKNIRQRKNSSDADDSNTESPDNVS